jgi:hypothetical protein
MIKQKTNILPQIEKCTLSIPSKLNGNNNKKIYYLYKFNTNNKQ